MYAIIENGGKQYKAIEGNYIEVDLLPDEIGKKKTFDKVLLLSVDEKVEVGNPYLKSISVNTTVLSHFKGEKITVFKYRAKQRYRVKTGHRQKYSRVIVDSIVYPGKSTKKKSETVSKAKPAATKKTPATTAKKAVAPKKSTSSAKKSTGSPPKSIMALAVFLFWSRIKKSPSR